MWLVLVFCILASLLVNGQSTPAAYTALYTKTVETTLALNPENVRVNVGDNPLAKEMAEGALTNMAGSPIMLQFVDSLVVFSDSTTCFQLPCNSSSSGTGVRLRVKPTQTVITQDSYYSLTPVGGGTRKQRPIATLVKTDTAERVLDYECELYRSEDAKLKVWICKAMPSSINGGLPLKIAEGAVLKYELHGQGKKASATLLKLYTQGN